MPLIAGTMLPRGGPGFDYPMLGGAKDAGGKDFCYVMQSSDGAMMNGENLRCEHRGVGVVVKKLRKGCSIWETPASGSGI